jgi:hypothetical protein
MPNNLYSSMGQGFGNQQFALALNRPNFMNAMPQMQANQRTRLPQQGGPMTQQGMRPGNVGGGPGGQQFLANVNQRPNPQVMRAMNPVMSINPGLRAQGPVPMQRSPNMMAPNTRLNRPQNMPQFRNMQPNINQMPHGLMPQQMRMPQQQNMMSPELDENSWKNLDNVTSDEAKKQLLGEALFKHVTALTPAELSAKVTGMLLETDFNDVRTMVDLHSKNPQGSRLSQQIEKAMGVLNIPRSVVVGGGGNLVGEGSGQNGSV